MSNFVVIAGNVRCLLIGALALAASAFSANAWDDVDPPAEKRSQLGLHLLAYDAYQMLRDNRPRVLFIDVRTPPEVQLLGVARLVDANVPYKVHSIPHVWDDGLRGLALEGNPAFVSLIDRQLAAKGLKRDAVIVLICASGVLSPRAADDLAAAGFTRVYTIIDGFDGDQIEAATPSGRMAINGWKLSGLPWLIPDDRRYFSLALKHR